MTEIPWHAFETNLRSFVRRRIDDGRADDVVSDILLRLVQSRAKLEAARNPMAWVYRVATNVITDHYRKNAREKEALQSITLDAQTHPWGGAEEPSDTAELANCLLPMIDNLPPRDAEALNMIEIQGLTQASAAQKLGLSLSGMKSRVQRARRKLKTDLLRCCRIEVNRRGEILDYRRHEESRPSFGPQTVSSNSPGADTSCCAPASCSSS